MRFLPYLCASALAFLGLLGSSGYAGILSATFEESLDLPNYSANGPRTFLNSNAPLGSGFELSAANETGNPSGWAGFLQIDLSGNILTLTHAENVTDFQVASVNISSIIFDLIGEYISNVQLVGSSIIDANASAPFTETISFTNDSISLNWSVADPFNTTDVFNFVEGGSATYEITLLSSTNTVPEPSSVAIFGLCAFGIAVMRRLK